MSLVKQILARVDHLPAIPGVAQRVLALVSDPDFSFARLVEIVRLDPGITAHVLRMCNSPYYGLRQKVSSLQQAMTLLGVDQVVQIVLSSEVVKVFRKGQDGYALAKGELWRHSMATALLAQRLGERLGFGDVATLFTAALLHDVGKLILSEHVAEKFAAIERLVREEGMSFVAAERKVLGLDHAILGGAVARHWNFPEAIARAIALHHDPIRSQQDGPLTRLVALANLLVVSMGVGGGAEGLATPAPPELLAELGLKGRDLDAFILEMKDILDQADDLLGLAR